MDYGGESAAVGDAEFGTGPVEVALNSTDRYYHPIGDLPVGQSASGQGDDLALAHGEWQRHGQRGQRGGARALAGLRQPARAAGGSVCRAPLTVAGVRR